MDYKVIYTNRKTLNITVERDRSIVVRAPHHTTAEKIASIMEKKKLWLYQKVNHPQKYQQQVAKKEYVNGESFRFLGYSYPLIIVEVAVLPLDFNETTFRLLASAKSVAPQLFQEWYTAQAKKIIPPRAARYAKELGVTYKSVKINDTKYRWGSCTPNKNLYFNWRLLKAPYFVIDYLIVHELVHLLIPNHSAEFWSLVGTVHPEWGKGKEWLRVMGEGL